MYYKNKFKDAKMTIKKVWKTVNDILGKQTNRAPTSIRKEGKIITEPKELSEAFNNIFQEK